MTRDEIEDFANTVADLMDEHTHLSPVECDYLYNLITSELAERFGVDIES